MKICKFCRCSFFSDTILDCKASKKSKCTFSVIGARSYQGQRFFRKLELSCYITAALDIKSSTSVITHLLPKAFLFTMLDDVIVGVIEEVNKVHSKQSSLHPRIFQRSQNVENVPSKRFEKSPIKKGSKYRKRPIKKGWNKNVPVKRGKLQILFCDS